jgi:uncharacterized protein YndB with AHSA1/START domain
MKVQSSIDIAASPQKVWPFLVEPEKILKWCITYQKFEYTGAQRPGVGSTFYLEEKAGGPLMKLNFTVTDWVENQRLACKMTSGNFLKGYEQKMTVKAIPSGSRFTFAEEIKLPYGVIGSMMGFFARSSSQAHLKEMMGKLKNLAEA